MTSAARIRTRDESENISISQSPDPFTRLLAQHGSKSITAGLETVLGNGRGALWRVPIADLVLTQVTGDFAGLLDSFPKKEGDSFIESDYLVRQARTSATHPELFTRIVDKTIEAQFGERHAAMRELTQNAIDAYAADEHQRPVAIGIENGRSHFTFRIRDFGAGMPLESLVRDLLIPYNSGKEFDPNKIGEHGIGWYSVADLADAVVVRSRTEHSPATVSAVLTNVAGVWQSTIQPFADSSSALSHPGTEVIAYINYGKTTPKDVAQHLSHAVGFVDGYVASITVNGTPINDLRNEYRVGSSVPVAIGDTPGVMTLGVSRDSCLHRENDERYKLRLEHKHAIAVTQRGLFVEYRERPFFEETLHSMFFQAVKATGYDLWAELPTSVTLTKGRNSVIADHEPAVAESLYKAFENVFVDQLLTDEPFMREHGEAIGESIGKALKQSATQASKRIHEQFSFGQRVSHSLEAILGATFDAFSSVAAFLTKSRSLPQLERANEIEPARPPQEPSKPIDWNSVKEGAYAGLRKTGKLTVGVGAAGGTLAAAYEAAIAFPAVATLAAGVAATTVAGSAAHYGITRAGSAIRDSLRTDSSEQTRNAVVVREGVFGEYPSFGELGAYVRSFHVPTRVWRESKRFGSAVVSSSRAVGLGAYTSLVDIGQTDVSDLTRRIGSGIALNARYLLRRVSHSIDFYSDVDAKRERAKIAYMNKLANKYVSKLAREDFLKRVLKKQIVPVREYLALDETAPLNVEVHREVFVSKYSWSPTDTPTEYRYLLKKLSIEDIVALHVSRKLSFRHLSRERPIRGEHIADNDDPFVKKIGSVLASLPFMDPKKTPLVLEDRLNAAGHGLVALSRSSTNAAVQTTYHLAGSAYALSGLGLIERIVRGPEVPTLSFKDSFGMALVDRVVVVTPRVASAVARAGLFVGGVSAAAAVAAGSAVYSAGTAVVRTVSDPALYLSIGRGARSAVSSIIGAGGRLRGATGAALAKRLTSFSEGISAYNNEFLVAQDTGYLQHTNVKKLPFLVRSVASSQKFFGDRYRDVVGLFSETSQYGAIAPYVSKDLCRQEDIEAIVRASGLGGGLRDSLRVVSAVNALVASANNLEKLPIHIHATSPTNDMGIEYYQPDIFDFMSVFSKKRHLRVSLEAMGDLFVPFMKERLDSNTEFSAAAVDHAVLNAVANAYGMRTLKKIEKHRDPYDATPKIYSGDLLLRYATAVYDSLAARGTTLSEYVAQSLTPSDEPREDYLAKSHKIMLLYNTPSRHWPRAKELFVEDQLRREEASKRYAEENSKGNRRKEAYGRYGSFWSND